MRLYTNESVPIAVAEGLKRRGVDAFTARDVGNLGLSDEEQLAFARLQNAVIFTHDDDFLKIAHDWRAAGHDHSGIIYVHQQRFGVGESIRRLKLLDGLLTQADMYNHVEFL
jgi:hypothetical protein